MKVCNSGAALRLEGFSDADFAADKTNRKSVTGGVVLLNGMPILWVRKKHGGVALSTMETEFTAASHICRDLIGFRQLLLEIRLPVEPMTLMVDNQAAIKQLRTESTSASAKHIDIRIKFVYLHTHQGVIEPVYVESRLQPADLLTKTLPAPRPSELRNILHLCDPKKCRYGDAADEEC
ncbi:hypothetical protein PR003_g3591 [Phytophthora rubi]|uniref:Reverse transcriptase Ty1/copia-type domain-containing protein n=1 Tax=Phytophthora rubi TaxID=129364 RepID=A0A6A3NQ31_9STRA|nr:hypothetical protein PR001_g4169 [Phytophthora rubi]KAE9353996.1 hypothetical protein PR003_g3591 [Phytophthora rubi]